MLCTFYDIIIAEDDERKRGRAVNILICDDDREIAEGIAIYLRHAGYGTFLAHDGREALDVLQREDIHLLIIDIMMPVMDGIEATRRIRQHSNIPIIMLSAKSEEVDKIQGLDFGADDYITKPFGPMELCARVASQLRRFVSLGSMPAAGEGIYTVGGLVLDDNSKAVTIDGEDARLTPLEYKILLLLMRSPGRVFSIDEIYERVWGEDSLGSGSTVTVHIRRIREKIEINPSDPKYIKVVWGIGYKMEKLDRG